MQKTAKIFIAGHRGLAGSAIVRELQRQGYTNLLLRTHAELDLTNQAAIESFFSAEKPEYVVLAAARVGGLFENAAKPADFIGQNLLIQTLTIDAACRHGVKKFVFLGSSCIYPRIVDRNLVEDDILTAPLEKTNEAYAVAKIAGTKMAEFYQQQYGPSTGFQAVTLMPPNLIGPGDNFDPQKAHVAQGLMVRMRAAKLAGDATFTVWGSGTPVREYMYIDDFASAAVYLLANPTPYALYNVGTGEEITILQIAEKVKKLTGFAGELVTDPTKPDGTPRKVMDVSRLFALGWRPQHSVDDAFRLTYQWYLENIVK